MLFIDELLRERVNLRAQLRNFKSDYDKLEPQSIEAAAVLAAIVGMRLALVKLQKEILSRTGS
jgi:hypothetical protein